VFESDLAGFEAALLDVACVAQGRSFRARLDHAPEALELTGGAAAGIERLLEYRAAAITLARGDSVWVAGRLHQVLDAPAPSADAALTSVRIRRSA